LKAIIELKKPQLWLKLLIMNTITLKINEKTKKGKAFVEMACVFF